MAHATGPTRTIGDNAMPSGLLTAVSAVGLICFAAVTTDGYDAIDGIAFRGPRKVLGAAVALGSDRQSAMCCWSVLESSSGSLRP